MRTNLRLFGTLLGMLLLAGWTGPATADQPAAAKRVVVVTGEDGPYHNWRATAPVLKTLLAKDPRLEVTLVEDLKFLASAELRKYDAVVLHFKNFDPKVPGPAAQRNLEEYVRGGGGLVLVHFACGAFQEWPEFVQLAGRVWNPKFRPHDPHGKFRVEIADGKHPITRGMTPFETTDELYTCLDGTVPIHVLATAVSKVDKKVYPMAFVLEPGKGRTFHCVLGHDVGAYAAAGVGELFRRGTAWAAGLEPAPAGSRQ
jgi:type 1 glutamine amidotransferase